MLEDIWVTLSELDNVTFSFKQLDENYVASEYSSHSHRDSGGPGVEGTDLGLPCPSLPTRPVAQGCPRTQRF